MAEKVFRISVHATALMLDKEHVLEIAPFCWILFGDPFHHELCDCPLATSGRGLFFSQCEENMACSELQLAFRQIPYICVKIPSTKFWFTLEAANRKAALQAYVDFLKRPMLEVAGVPVPGAPCHVLVLKPQLHSVELLYGKVNGDLF